MVLLVLAGCSPTVHEAKPRGSWTAVASGESAGVRWEVLRTAATEEGECFSFTLDPPPDAEYFALSAEENGYRGRLAACGFGFTDVDGAEPAEVMAVVRDRKAPYAMVFGAARPEVTVAGTNGSGVAKDVLADVSGGRYKPFMFLTAVEQPVSDLRLRQGRRARDCRIDFDKAWTLHCH
jgi:hypothetical protein